MNARRSNRILGWALAFSLATHAVLLYFAQGMKFTDASDQPAPLPKIRISILVPPTPPPASPTPPPEVMPPRPAPQTRAVAVAPPALPKPDNPGPSVGPAVPPVIGDPGPDIPPGTDAPLPTVAPLDCSDPNQDARAIDPVVPDTPEIAQEEGLTGTALIKVSLDAAGVVTDVSVYRSSGSGALDAAAEQAARRTAYRPQLENCEPVAGSYLFSANFTP